MHNRTFVILVITAATILTASGCEDENSRLVSMAEKQLARQEKEASRAHELQREVAEGSRRLVEADAEARRELITVQRELQSERSELGRQRDQLEAERRDLAERRHLDPVIAEAIFGMGTMLACLLPLILCWYLLQRPSTSADDSVVAEHLLEELIVSRPLLLPPESRPNIGRQNTPPALNDAEGDRDADTPE